MPPDPVILDNASGNGLSDASAPGDGYTMASHPATPIDDKYTSTHNTISVTSADPNPMGIFRLGFFVSSATFASPSSPRKNQIANGTAAPNPTQPLGKALC